MKWILVSLLIVISNPYESIDYAQINSYDLGVELLEDVIHVTEAEAGGDPEAPAEEMPAYRPPTAYIFPWEI